MWHKPCRTFHPWCPCINTRCLSASVCLIIKWDDDVIKWNNFPRNGPFVRGIQRPSADSPHKGQWRRALMCSLICTWANAWACIICAGDLRRHRAHNDVLVMVCGDMIGNRAQGGGSGGDHRTYIPHSIKHSQCVDEFDPDTQICYFVFTNQCCPA